MEVGLVGGDENRVLPVIHHVSKIDEDDSGCIHVLDVPPTRLIKITKKRKLEIQDEAEKKRRKILDSVATAPSLHSITSTDCEKGKNPLEIFPQEIWVEVLFHLKNKEDMAHAQETCSLFHNILESRRVSEVLFPEIMKIPQFYEYLSPDAYNEDMSFNDLKDGINQQLVLRSVCSKWKSVVDEQIEHKLKRRMDDMFGFFAFFCVSRFMSEWWTYSDQVPSRPDKLKSVMDSMRNDKTIKKCATELRPIKSITIIVTGEDAQFKSGFETIMRCAGDQILELNLNLFVSIVELARLEIDDHVRGMLGYPSTLYLNLKSWLTSTSNLKCLQLRLMDYDGLLDSECLQHLKDTIAANSFTTLNSLQQLKLVMIDRSGFEGEFYSAIIQANSHVTELGLTILPIPDFDENDIIRDTSPFQQTVNTLTNIQVFSFNFMAQEHFMYQLQFKSNWRWPLSKIHIECSNREELTTEDVFHYLETYRTLQDVSITTPVSALVENGAAEGDFLILPEVTSFKYEFRMEQDLNLPWNRRSLINIDFLFRMKKLEKLRWLTEDMPENVLEIQRRFGENDELIQFRAGRMDLYSSNVWTVFPKLKEIVIGTNGDESKRVYKRELRD